MATAVDSAVCDAAADLIRHYGFASGSLTRDDLHDLGVACEVGKEVLRRKARGLVNRSNGLPILSSKSCDGTPINIAFQEGTKLPSGAKQQVRGRRGREFLVANQFVRTKTPQGGWDTCVLLGEATPLTFTKTAPAVFQAAQQHWQSLRSLGHRGPAIEHLVADRCGLTALDRLHRQFHAAQPPMVPRPEEDPAFFPYLEFVLLTPCALHDAQNGFRWGYAPQFKDKQLMRDLYVAIESLRNSADLLWCHMCDWIQSCLRFVEPRDESWHDNARMLWTALDVDHEVVQILVEDLELQWADGYLWVRAGAEVERGGQTHIFVWGCPAGWWRGEGHIELQIVYVPFAGGGSRFSYRIRCRTNEDVAASEIYRESMVDSGELMPCVGSCTPHRLV